MAELTFKPVKPSDVPRKATGNGRPRKYAPFVERFLQSNADVAEIELNGLKPANAASNIRNAAKGKPVFVVQRGQRVFIAKNGTKL